MHLRCGAAWRLLAFGAYVLASTVSASQADSASMLRALQAENADLRRTIQDLRRGGGVPVAAGVCARARVALLH